MNKSAVLAELLALNPRECQTGSDPAGPCQPAGNGGIELFLPPAWAMFVRDAWQYTRQTGAGAALSGRQIGFAHALVGCDIRDRALNEDAPALDDCGPAGHMHGEAHILLR